MQSKTQNVLAKVSRQIRNSPNWDPANYLRLSLTLKLTDVLKHSFWYSFDMFCSNHRLKKGQKIGLVGSTRASSAPHLHYEIWLNGSPINPIDYVLDGLTPKEYRELVKRAQQDNQSFD